MPIVSVIVPVYKAEKYIHRCIDSIVAQTMPDFELLLIDDGSPDRSGEICDEYAQKDSRIRAFHKENGGASSARNIGLENASGEWITFVDSDDMIEQNYFNILESDKADLLIQKWRYSHETDTNDPLIEGIYKDKLYISFMEENAQKHIMRMVAAKFLRRDIIEKNNIRYKTNISLGEDTLFMQEYYGKISSVAVCNTSCYIYFRPGDWDENKHKIDALEFRLFFQTFYKSYKYLPYRNIRLYPLLFHFFLGKLKNNYSLSLRLRVFVNTIPECVKLERMTSPHITWKWYVKLSLSIFNKFLV